MATRPIVPRANGEGSLGVSTKSWGGVFTNELNGANAVDMADFSKATLRQPSTAYAVGAMAYHATLPAGWYLECTTAGNTGSGTLTITSPTVGGTVSDGTVTWTIRKNASTQDLTGYLPLSGGAMTNTAGKNFTLIARNDETGAIVFSGRGDDKDSARIATFGNNFSDSKFAGAVYLCAANGNDTADIIFKPNGEVYYTKFQSGSPAVTASLDKSAVVAESLGANGYIKYASGLIIQWGTLVVNGVTSVTYPISFSTTAQTVVTPVNSTQNVYTTINTALLNGCSIKHSFGTVDIWCNWHAIGY